MHCSDVNTELVEHSSLNLIFFLLATIHLSKSDVSRGRSISRFLMVKCMLGKTLFSKARFPYSHNFLRSFPKHLSPALALDQNNQHQKMSPSEDAAVKRAETKVAYSGM